MSAAPMQLWESGRGSDVLGRARALGVLSALDEHFARRLAKLFGEEEEELRWALALACRQEASGHVCADLGRLEREGIVAEVAGEARRIPLRPEGSGSFSDWLGRLKDSRLVHSGPGIDSREKAGTARPLVLDDTGRLYLSRAFAHERDLAERIRLRAEAPDQAVDWEWAAGAIGRLAPGDEVEQALPRAALRIGLGRSLSVVTGGPGTGKTTMVARLIALLVEQAHALGNPPPRVRLLAPTGKAAAAMANAFTRGRDLLDVPEAVREALPKSAETLHRALYRQTRLDAFGRPEQVRLDAEVVVVDEASMVDLEWMNRLFEACERVPRLILLGDPGQLASVAAGAVLAELCDGPAERVTPLASANPDGGTPSKPGGRGRKGKATAEGQGELFALEPVADAPPAEASASEGVSSFERATGTSPALAQSLVVLERSHRFEAGGGIGLLASAIRSGEADRAIEILHDPEITEVERCDVVSHEAIIARLVRESLQLQVEIGNAEAPLEKLNQMGLYRVLCAYRRGPFGVEGIAARLDEAAAAQRKTTPRAGWWLGRMLLVTRNAPESDLWNGDVGLIEETEQGLRALFPDAAGGTRALSAGRLPSHESAIAMSVHKSQGSEFDVVDLVLGDRASALMTRELLYTGVTRARKGLRIHASEATLREMIGLRIQRDSGLRDRLWAD